MAIRKSKKQTIPNKSKVSKGILNKPKECKQKPKDYKSNPKDLLVNPTESKKSDTDTKTDKKTDTKTKTDKKTHTDTDTDTYQYPYTECQTQQDPNNTKPTKEKFINTIFELAKHFGLPESEITDRVIADLYSNYDKSDWSKWLINLQMYICGMKLARRESK